MKVVTSGSPYLDIDAYGGIIAYSELLNLLGDNAVAVTTAPLNESISETVHSWPVNLSTNYRAAATDSYVLVDVSDPEFFESFVDQGRVVEVIDHHLGFEDYWHRQIGAGADIDFIGAACTLVYEKWKNRQLLSKMSTTSARLLICGVLDNTLNFGAKVTTNRDREAYAELKRIAGLPENWTAQYFTECQQAILADLKTALTNDKKVLKLKTSRHSICAGQLVVWEANPVLDKYAKIIASTLSVNNSDWFLNLVSIEEGKSYFYCDSTNARQWLSETLGVDFDNKLAVADRLWLRKEIIKQDIDRASSK